MVCVGLMDHWEREYEVPERSHVRETCDQAEEDI